MRVGLHGRSFLDHVGDQAGGFERFCWRELGGRVRVSRRDGFSGFVGFAGFECLGSVLGGLWFAGGWKVSRGFFWVGRKGEGRRGGR